MRAVVQRVNRSAVTVEGSVTGAIQKGLMVLLGVSEDDTDQDAAYMADKITGLRIFEDDEEKMNLSVMDVEGDILAVSQFTLFGDCRKGKRPSFVKAARPEPANRLYRAFVEACKAKGVRVEEGVFQTHMIVEIENDGPVTVLIDSKKEF
ncbi:D-aminoacyl-tRNA deacylase [Bacilliculturomica massiliensis]|uniref:D-aminoacyl-tRNA deacylase n=1 Tax=Bacilliculturomica massiliensis TaxID=1917867 RepID=UPI0010302B8D|nr:D-aminoacyl-tRNA deacylase [Bacilliculturomica massiliensis]